MSYTLLLEIYTRLGQIGHQGFDGRVIRSMHALADNYEWMGLNDTYMGHYRNELDIDREIDKMWVITQCLGRPMQEEDMRRWIRCTVNRHQLTADGHFVDPDHAALLQKEVTMTRLGGTTRYRAVTAYGQMHDLFVADLTTYDSAPQGEPLDLD